MAKHEGEPVKRGEIIAEIETDKSNMELESYANGILARIVVKEGERRPRPAHRPDRER